MTTQETATDDVLRAWDLEFTSPIGPHTLGLVLRSRGDRLIGAWAETFEGWRAVEALTSVDGLLRFETDASIFPLRFTLAETEDGLTGEAEDPPIDRPTRPRIGAMTVEGIRVRPPEQSRLDPLPLPHGALDTYLPVIREAAALEGWTLYGPATAGSFPLVVWGNGGARPSNEEFLTFLTQLAAHGFVVLAAGAPERRFTPAIGDRDPEVLRRAVDWALTAPPQLVQAGADPARLAVMGQSAGASQAWGVADHAAVRTLVAFNGGSGAIDHLEHVAARVRVPTLLVTGGDTDLATAPIGQDWDSLDPSVPAAWADHFAAGHIGLFHGTNDPLAAAAGLPHLGQEVEVQASRLAVCWLDTILNGNASAAAYFSGPKNRLGAIRGWTIRTRRL